MFMIIHWANEKDLNGSKSSQIYPNICSSEDGAKEKNLFEEKSYRDHDLCGTRA